MSASRPPIPSPIAALIEGRVDPAWARWVRPWTLAAWTCLTAGVALGSWWAYYELGWGGWWYWDPVENASFMPWLLGTALLHSAAVVEKRGALKSWTILLAILTFALSLIGTFLVRSGVLTSVHTFASDPARGLFILVLILLAVGGGLALYAWRAPGLEPGGLFRPISREGALVLNNLLLGAATATVFLGTLYPLFLDVAGGGRVSVGPPYFEATFVPLMAPLVVAMAVGPLLAWKRGDIAAALERLWAAALIAGLVLLAGWWLSGGTGAPALLGLALAAWLLAGTATEWAERVGLFRASPAESLRRVQRLPRAAHGMTLAHIGLALVVAGATVSSAWKSEAVLAMRPGEATAFAGYDIRLDSVSPIEGPNYRAERALFSVLEDGERVAELTPERRVYLASGTATTEAAIHTNGISDLHAVVGERGDGGTYTVRLYHQPLVPWIWIGVLAMVAGGLLSLSDRRLRVGAARRATAGAARARAAP